jgi:amidase
MHQYTFATSKAFVKELDIKPYQSGMLDHLTFAVKDLIDIAGEITGCGNPTWAKTHPVAVANAFCVEQLLSAGGICVGKTITDELAYSLIGENYFYGTPINPQVPNRVPGGSSSGSASAVACGIVDFALGTDTGGSVRVPASNCGIWGYRPSHGLISVAGVNQFAPSFDTVGVLAKSAEVLKQAVSILIGSSRPKCPQANLFMLEDIFSICDHEIQQELVPLANRIDAINKINLSKIVGHKIDHTELFDNYVGLQCLEIWSCLGSWIEDTKPEFGTVTADNFYNLAKKAERAKTEVYVRKRELFARKLNDFLGEKNILCFPTTPTLAPLLNTIGQKSQERTSGIYYPRALGINAISGLSRAPQITIPGAQINGVPLGLSLLAAYGQDELLLDMCQNINLL